ncbi:MAG TPA: tetratricopeptide repeat protein, partial [Blastocatellia bacterium]|nr:tetratricopeptide repeat protein [Blastocatellia bacterium]
GNALARLGNLDEAAESIMSAISQGDTAADAHLDLGLILYGQGRLEAAIKEFRAALDLRRGFDAEAHRNLGRALYESGALDQARAEFETAIAQRERLEGAEAVAGRRPSKVPNTYPEAHHDLGCVLYDQGHSAQAMTEFRAAIEQRGGHFPRAHYDLGRALVRTGYYSEAMAELKKAIDQQGGLFPAAYFEIGILLSRQGDVAGALDAYQTAVKQSGGIYPEAYYQMGSAYVRSRDAESAVKAYRKAIEQRGGYYPQAHQDLGRVLYSIGDIEEANEEYSIAVRQRAEPASGVMEREIAAEAGRKGRRNGLEAAELETALRQAPTATDSGKADASGEKATRHAHADEEEYIEVADRRLSPSINETEGD